MIRARNHWLKLGFGLAALAIASQAQARDNGNVSYICPQLDLATGELSVRVDTGCRTGMARYKDNDLELIVDQTRAQIIVQGGIEYHPLTSQIVTADCAGARSITLTASNVEPRRYGISYQGDMLGTRDLQEDPAPKKCLGTQSSKQHDEIEAVDAAKFLDWSENATEGWQDWRANDLTELIAPLLAGHPETEEGLPSLSVNIRKVRWVGMWNLTSRLRQDPFVGVGIVRHGLLDDAVSGERYFAELDFVDGNWMIRHLWSQQMCARGDRAGQWSSQPCG